MSTHSCAVCVTIFSTRGKFRLHGFEFYVVIYTLTLAARSYALLLMYKLILFWQEVILINICSKLGQWSIDRNGSWAYSQGVPLFSAVLYLVSFPGQKKIWE